MTLCDRNTYQLHALNADTTGFMLTFNKGDPYLYSEMTRVQWDGCFQMVMSSGRSRFLEVRRIGIGILRDQELGWDARSHYVVRMMSMVVCVSCLSRPAAKLVVVQGVVDIEDSPKLQGSLWRRLGLGRCIGLLLSDYLLTTLGSGTLDAVFGGLCSRFRHPLHLIVM